MTEQALDLRRSVQIVRRHMVAVAMVAVAGLLAGAGYAVVKPPMQVSSALVVLPSANDVATQIVVASSNPVLSGALGSAGPPASVQALRSRVQVRNVAPNVLSFNAEGKTATAAENTANAVADSYMAYVSSRNSPVGRLEVRLLERATQATGTSLPIHLISTAGIGALAGALIGAVGALVISRRDRRLWQRDEIADAVGASVLASLPVDHPAGVAQWIRLIDRYEPSAVLGWRLRNTLRDLGLIGSAAAQSGDAAGSSIAVLSLSSDPAALAIGPQLAAFAASAGIVTALVAGPQQDTGAAAPLCAACAAWPPPSADRSGRVRAAVAERGYVARDPDAALTVVVAVVDDRDPRVAGTMHTSVTVIGVSAGAATAAQLAQLAASSADDGRPIDGILVADPDPADHTTGRIPPLVVPARRSMPSPVNGMPVRANGRRA